ncbi:MAG: 6-carboxytetrahydropterin synthase QueD [Pseudomonadota bacterium]
MRVELAREYRFEASHRLPRVQANHRCAREHGHSYRVEIVLAGTVDEDTGFLVDYADMDRAMAPLLECLDHHSLNEVAGLENPTSEMLARWLWDGLLLSLPLLREVTVYETWRSRCTYRGE